MALKVKLLAADGMKTALVVLQQCLNGINTDLVAMIHDEVIVQTHPFEGNVKNIV
jgi:hypothetical protein